ncbi:hypothetical protein ACTZWW_04065 [Salinarimonas sp. NSM]|uniref:hypothetical protein n=1 Tax=Salinarimonas sp. NSM TaxID=3458003 RepID=UPI0040371C60
MTLARTAATIYAPFAADGTARQPSLAESQLYHMDIERRVVGLSGGATVFDTRAAMNAYLTPNANTLGYVYADATVASNGIYRKIGGSGTGSWVRIGDLPERTVVFGGASGSNAVTATPDVPPPTRDLAATFRIVWPNTNTSTTVTLNGVRVKDAEGADPAVGDLIGGRIYEMLAFEGVYRLSLASGFGAAAVAVAADRAAAQVARGGAEEALAEVEAVRDAFGARFGIAVSEAGRPASGLDLALVVATFPLRAPANFAAPTPAAPTERSYARAVTAATASTVFSVRKNGVQFGTITFAVGATAGTFAATETTFAPGDVISVRGPDIPDATLADVSVTLLLERLPS